VPEAAATLPFTSTDDPDVVLFSGPMHVITYMGDHVRDMTQRSPIGDPVRLAFVDPALRATQTAMDRVYETGVSEDVVNTYGPVRLCALTEGHRVVGVGALHEHAGCGYHADPPLFLVPEPAPLLPRRERQEPRH
jgi:hypothetical protein